MLNALAMLVLLIASESPSKGTGALHATEDSIEIPRIVASNSNSTVDVLITDLGKRFVRCTKISTSCECKVVRLLRDFDPTTNDFEIQVDLRRNAEDRLQSIEVVVELQSADRRTVSIPFKVHCLVGSPVLSPINVNNDVNNRTCQLEFANDGIFRWSALSVAGPSGVVHMFARIDRDGREVWEGDLGWNELEESDAPQIVTASAIVSDNSQRELKSEVAIRFPPRSPYRWITRASSVGFNPPKTKLIAILKKNSPELPVPKIHATEMEDRGTVECKLLKEMGMVCVFEVEFTSPLCETNERYQLELEIANQEQAVLRFEIKAGSGQ